MKRIIMSAFLVAIVAGIVAAPASAAVKHFDGKVEGGGKIAFDVKFNKHGVPKSAGYFSFSSVPVRCGDGARGGVNFSYNDFVPVTDRKFSYHFSSFKASFEGKISRNGKNASGKVSYGPGTLSGHPNCTTGGKRDWTAST